VKALLLGKAASAAVRRLAALIVRSMKDDGKTILLIRSR
jgi:hypothetical protein